MSVRLRDSLTSGLDQLRHEPTAKRVRAQLGGVTAVDSTRALLLWEPRRVVPVYAVPEGDIHGDLVPAAAAVVDTDGLGFHMPVLSERRLLDPSVPFDVHTADGQALDLRVGAVSRPGVGFRLVDSDLAGYVVLDFAAFDAWREEDEPIVSHPRDPFHRLDILTSSRHVRLEVDGTVLAESSRPTLLFETMLPARYYLPREDVRAELIPSEKRTFCAYKGQAAYWSVAVGGSVIPDLAWTYEQPLHEAAQVRDLVAFFNERVDAVVDGTRHDRPVTGWSKPDRSPGR